MLPCRCRKDRLENAIENATRVNESGNADDARDNRDCYVAIDSFFAVICLTASERTREAGHKTQYRQSEWYIPEEPG